MHLPVILVTIAATSVYTTSGLRQCPTQKPIVTQQCRYPTLFAFDVSDTIAPNDVTIINNYIFDNLLPSLARGQEVGITFGGVASTTLYQTPITSFYPVLCDELNDVYNVFSANKPFSLARFLQRIVIDYNDFMDIPYFVIVLFTASTNTSDIQAAANIISSNMPNVLFNVVSMSGRIDIWNRFPHVFPMYPWDLATYTSTVMYVSCGYSDDPYYQTSEQTPVSQPTTSPYIDPKTNFECRCNPGTYGADVVLVFDNSYLTGYLRQFLLLETVQKALAAFNIQTDINGMSGNKTTRIAIVTYSSTSSYSSKSITQYELGELSQQQFQNLLTIQRKNDPYRIYNFYPYPDAALSNATAILTASRRYRQVLPVVIHLTGSDQTYQSTYFPYTNAQVSQIRSIGGVLLTYQFFGTGDLPTGGYFDQYIAGSNTIPAAALYTKQRAIDPQFIVRGLCQAVCKCPTGYISNTVDSAYHTPVGGCFRAQSATNNPTAERNCSKTNDGIVAPTKTAAESQLIDNMVGNVNFYTGMKWNGTRYIWSDGTPLNGIYQPWFPSLSLPPPSGQNCVMVYGTEHQEWVPTDCRNGFAYACKTHPCDSEYLC